LSSEEKNNDTDVIFVNKKRFEVSAESLTGTQILQLAGYDPNQYDLFLMHGQKDELIGPTQSVHIEDGLHFNAILRNVPYGD
jgi:multiubiquitin